MDDLLQLIPPKYLGAAAAILLLLRALDALIRLIPDKYLAAHTTEQALVNAVLRVLGFVTKAKLPDKSGTAGLVLALLLAPALVRADEAPTLLYSNPQGRVLRPDYSGKLQVALVAVPEAPADTRAQPSAPTDTATPAAPHAPSAAEAAAKVAACTIAGIPDAVGKCIANPGNPAPLDSRAFWMSFGTGLGTSVLVPVVTLALTHWWPVTNDVKP